MKSQTQILGTHTSYVVYGDLCAKLKSIARLTNRLMLFSGPLGLCPFEEFTEDENNFTVALFEPLLFNICLQSLSGTPPTVIGVIAEEVNDSRTSETTFRTSGHSRTSGTLKTTVSKKANNSTRYIIFSCQIIIVWTYEQGKNLKSHSRNKAMSNRYKLLLLYIF